MASDTSAPHEGHPLYGKDDLQCYEVMMAERSRLIAAKLISEDSLIKTIIQLSVAILVAMVGFLSSDSFSVFRFIEIRIAIVFLFLSIIIGIFEYKLSSVAYQRQISVVINFYTMKSSSPSYSPGAWDGVGGRGVSY
ncbi:hypothetical protein [Sphingosinicella soli]|uniref:Uncharacterized protein n=1 Tax=Sphingosinicella soli TaxID=333708 RepID=A0A7W7B3T4_9SPHN|nr:hypothetical protein [Sphingosinicella soli]MBB4633477.1 hypothetical protein [Sphingosinicella soli]